jgi:trigger factor
MTEAAETEERKFSPSSQVQEAGPCKLKIHIEISADRVKEEIERKYKELNDSMALPGFRKGHAPRSLMERKFGKALLDDLKHEMVHHAFDEVREEKKLEPVAVPDLDPEKMALEEGKPFAFDLEIEVRPTLDIKDYAGLKVRKPAFTVEEREVEAVLRNFQDIKAEFVPVEGQPAQEHDQVIADFDLIVDGQAIDRSENTALHLNADISFYGVSLPEFHKSIEGRTVGETVETKVQLPADFPEKAHAGKEALIRAALKSVKRKKLPEVDAEFAKSFDMDSVDELRAHVRKRIEREKEERSRERMAEDLVQELIRTNDFPMPEGLVAAGAEEALRRLHLDLAMKGTSEEEIHKALDHEKETSKEGMRAALKAHFILEHIAQKERIFVLEEQVDERVGRLAAQYGKWPHEMRAYLEEQGLLTQLRRTMREDLVREFLLSKAVVEEEKKPEAAPPAGA